MSFEAKSFEIFDKQWALLTAGDCEKYNTMTISWGGMGTLWNKPVVTVYVKPVRHTFEYMENSEYFTVSFYGEEHRKALGLLGSLSGRDGDKVAKAGFTAEKCGECVTFSQAQTTLLCKKIYWQDLAVDRMPKEAVDKYYLTEEPHRMYVGEVVDIITK